MKENQYKEAEVVMLATENHTKLYLSKYGVLSQVYQVRNPSRYKQEGYKPQHLYIVSNEELKAGEWAINPNGRPEIFGHDWAAQWSREEILKCKKILATTDNTINVYTKGDYDFNDITGGTNYYHIPKPSDSFILEFIEKYNKGNQIRKVLVEYDEYFDSDSSNRQSVNVEGRVVNNYRLKVDSNNCITIKKVEPELYTREQVIELCEDYYDTLSGNLDQTCCPIKDEKKIIKNWIKENLK